MKVMELRKEQIEAIARLVRKEARAFALVHADAYRNYLHEQEGNENESTGGKEHQGERAPTGSKS